MTKKKILIGIAVLIIVVLGAVALEKYNTQRITLEKERLIAQCRQEVNEMDEKQLIGKINTLPIGTPEELEKVRNSNALMYKHLRCRFFENPFEEQFEQTKSLVQATNIPDDKKMRMINDFSKYLKSAQENREGVERRISNPPFPLIVYPKERICPDGKEDAGLVEKLLENAANSGYVGVSMEKAQNIISNYCAQIIKYSEDEFSLTKEVYDFKDWPADPLERRVEYRWRIILAFRFGGEAKALEVCDNLIDTKEKKDCQDKVDSFNGWSTLRIKAEECTGYELKEDRELICQVLGGN